METKQCTKCNINKDISNFYKRGESGYMAWCKQCINARTKERYRSDQKFREHRRSYCRQIQNQLYATSEAFREKVKKYENDRWHDDPQHRERLSEYRKRYDSARRRSDPLFRLKRTVRSLIGNYYRNSGVAKSTRTQEILGCGWNELHTHLTQTFVNNYNRLPTFDDDLHIDHIVPISSATTEDDVIRLCHYTNLQWLLAADNINKRDRLDWDRTKRLRTESQS